jgi:predicted nucleic acid-binding protein
MILDAGALIAIERGDRDTHDLLAAALDEGDDLVTHPMVIAQVWRDERGRQVSLARLLTSVRVIPIDAELGRRCGELLGKSRTSDPIDAAVVLMARPQETIVTSDPDEIRQLARVAKRDVVIVGC